MPSPQQKLFSLQQDLYEQAYKRAQTSIWGSSRVLKDYFRRFEADLPEHFDSTSADAIIRDLRKKDIILFGDFHTLQQSQRGFVRLVRSYINKYKTKKIILALEAFRARDQKYINAYLSGDLEEDDFLKKTHYHLHWHFAWSNFRVIFDLAKTFDIKIMGINSDRAGKDTLFKRDRFAANTLVDILGQNPDSKIFCLIGEFHLSKKHLPDFLTRRAPRFERPLEIARVVTNADKYYLKLNLFATRNTTDYLKLGDGYYCILNCPPWLKWQSYNIWEESQLADDALMEELSYSELETVFEGELKSQEIKYDMESHFHNILNVLCRFLNISLPSSELFNFNIFSGNRHDIEEYLKIFGPKQRKTFKQLQREIDSKRNVYLPEKNTALLTAVSINSLADMAGRFLYHKLHTQPPNLETPYHSFYIRVIIGACGFLSSKILNPNRKCLGYQEQKKLYSESQGKRLSGRAAIKRDAAKLFVKHEDWLIKKLSKKDTPFNRPISQIYRDDEKLGFYLSHALGKALGLKFYQKFIQGDKTNLPPDFLFLIPTEEFSDLWENFIFITRTLK